MGSCKLYFPVEANDSLLIFINDEGMRLPPAPALCGVAGLGLILLGEGAVPVARRSNIIIMV